MSARRDAAAARRKATIARPIGPTRFRWVIVALLSAVGFVLYIDRVNIQVAGLPMQKEFDLSDELLGSLWSAFFFGYAVGLIPGGWLADRFGAHRVLTVAAVSWGLITISTGMTRPVAALGLEISAATILFLLRFLLGVCEACAFPTFSRALANWMRQSERAQASGWIHGGSGLGGAFTPVFITQVILWTGWRQSFALSGLITFAVAALWWRLATDRPAQHRRVSNEEIQSIAADKEETHHEPVDRAWYGRLLRSRSIWLLCLSEFFYGLTGFVFLTWFYKYFVEVRGAGNLESATMASWNYLAMAVGATLGGFLCDRCVKRWGGPWGRRFIPLLTITASGLCSMIAPTVNNDLLAAGLFALAAGLMFTAASAFWSTLIDITRRGTGLVGGVMNGSGSLGSAVGTIYFATLYQQVGWQNALQIGGLMGIVSGLIWLGIDSSKQIDTPRENRT
jgi:ACS family glucarate transporter-like MFS transporter